MIGSPFCFWGGSTKFYELRGERMANYKIGQMLKVSADVELKGFFGDKKFIKREQGFG